jgi:Na+/proline symporter
MSSIDSALNSLSAVTVEDFIRPHFAPDSDPKKLLLTGRLCTLLWGLFAVIFAFQVEHIAPTVLETVNKVGSMVNGPLLALICSAVFLRGLTQPLALLAFGLGLTTNLLVAFYLPAVSWLWWNVVGFVTTFLYRRGGEEVATSKRRGRGQHRSISPAPAFSAAFADSIFRYFGCLSGVAGRVTVAACCCVLLGTPN